MRLDHLSYAAGPEGLAGCVQRLGSRLGAGFTDGGLHPSFGTRNFILPLAEGRYLEVVEALDHPAADQAPFGRAVRARSESGGGWLAWVLAVDDMAPIEERLSRPAVSGHRRRPDGFNLRWQQLGVVAAATDPQLPFFVHWQIDAAQHPSSAGGSVRLEHLEIAGQEAEVTAYLGDPAALPSIGVQVSWLDPSDDTGLVAAVFATPSGDVRID